MVVPSLTRRDELARPVLERCSARARRRGPGALAARGLPRVGHAAQRASLRDRRLLPLGALQAATFGLAVVAGNWAVPLLERQGASSAAAGLAGGLILFAGIVTRPAGGLLARAARARRSSRVALLGSRARRRLCSRSAARSRSAAARRAASLGLAAGLPFAIIFAAAQRRGPTRPAAAIALVNGVAVSTILVGTPLAGLAFELPGDGRLAFAAIAALAALTLLAASQRATLERYSRSPNERRRDSRWP